MDGKKKKNLSACKEESATRETDPPFLPMDVWVEILLRIPAEDLVKLKVVCKCWYELITSQSFARSHLDHWTTTSRPPFSGFAVQAYCSIDGFRTSSILYFTLHLDREGGKFECRDFLIEDCCRPSMDIELLASCDGLLLVGCVKNVGYGLFICNPITGSHRRLPMFQLTGNGYHWVVTENYAWAMTRNASTGQYKVFAVQPHYRSRRICHIFELQRDGREENSGNNWKALDAPLPEGWIIVSSTTTEGRVHWFAWGAEQFKVKILSIDVVTDELWASASVELLPGTDLCCTGAFYCTQPWNHGLRVWALENFDKPRWEEKRRIVHHHSPWSLTRLSLTRSAEPFIMPGGVKLVINNGSSVYNVMLEATTGNGSSNCLISWNADKVVPHVNSLIGFG